MTNFKNDIFISYAHIDNETMTDEQEGWVDMLHRALELRLAQLLGNKPRIWRDPTLRGIDEFNEEIVDELVKPDAPYFIIDYTDKNGELYIPEECGKYKLRKLSDKVNYVSFSPSLSHFIIDYDNGSSELWQGHNKIRSLTAEPDFGQKGHYFTSDNDHLIVWYNEGRADLLNLDWLEAMADEPANKVKTACNMLATEEFDTIALVTKYFKDDYTPKACQEGLTD